MKQVIIVNESLKLPRGKLAAQVAHAAVAAFLEASTEAKRLWLAKGMPKVVLQSDSAEELERLEEAAQKRGIPAYLIIDAGKPSWLREPSLVWALVRPWKMNWTN